MNKLLSFSLVLFFLPFEKAPIRTNTSRLNEVAGKYVTLGLAIGQYDPDFVEIYYGPDSLKPRSAKSKIFPKDSLLRTVAQLRLDLKDIAVSATGSDLNRARWLSAQLLAFGRRIKIFSGEYATFDEESKELFGAVAQVYPPEYFKKMSARIDSLLPGKGSVNERFFKLANKFIIPKNKLDIVFSAAIAEAKRRTLIHYRLPATESLTLEFVTNQPWAGYNWYKGAYKSVVQINTDLPIYISQAVDVGSHESYPGHHVFNMLLEKNLYHDEGLVEMSLYPLFSPQSLIAEGSANYGLQLAFPGDEKAVFAKNVLLPLAGLDTAGITTFFKAMEVRRKMDYATNEVARGLVNGTLSDARAVRMLGSTAGAKKEVSFIKKYRSYVINYTQGQDMIQNYIERNGGTEQNSTKRWQLFGNLLSNQVLITDLQN